MVIRACLLPPSSFLTLLENLWGGRICKWKITPFFSSVGEGNDHSHLQPRVWKISLTKPEMNFITPLKRWINQIAFVHLPLFEIICTHLKLKQRNPLTKPKIMKPRFRDVSPCSNECPIQNTILSSKSPEGSHLCYLSVVSRNIISLKRKGEKKPLFWELKQKGLWTIER